jgi:hypothetical protein
MIPDHTDGAPSPVERFVTRLSIRRVSTDVAPWNSRSNNSDPVFAWCKPDRVGRGVNRRDTATYGSISRYDHSLMGGRSRVGNSRDFQSS